MANPKKKLFTATVCLSIVAANSSVSATPTPNAVADGANTSTALTATFSQTPGSPNETTLSPKSGDSIKVSITDTCQSLFELSVENLVATAAPAPTEAAAAAAAAGQAPPPPACTGKDTLTATIKYDSQYTAYLVKVTPKAGVKVPITADTNVALSAADFLVYVGSSSPWTTDFSGGFTLSELTNPKYSLLPGSGAGAGTYTIQRDSGAEDSQTLGFAGFVTVSRNNWVLPSWIGSPTVGVTFGLGVNTGSRVEYFPGLSLKYGDLILTGGVNVGSVDTLSAGLKVGGTTTQANALGTLPTRTSGGAFIALSYKFLGSSVQSTLQSKISQPTPK